MDDIRLTRELVATGLNPAGIRVAVGEGTLQRLRRGAYADGLAAGADDQERHRRLVTATLRQGHPRSTVSHGSAAVLRGLEVPRAALERVHLTRDRRGGGQRREWLQVHGLPLPPAHAEEVDGVRTTTLPRTVVDLACTLPLVDAVAVGDAALRLGGERAELLEVLAEVGTRYGIGRARRALELLDGRSESYGESVSRVLMLEHGVPAPTPQLLVRDTRGVVVARVDFGWPEHGVVGEFDGRVKYGRGSAPDQDPATVLWREKLREDLLRDLGWQVVRWVWADLDKPRALVDRLERAFARGRVVPT